MGEDRRGLNPVAAPAPRWLRPVLVAVPAAFFAVLFVYPMATILARGLGSRGRYGVIDLVRAPHLRGVVWFTLWQAAVSTLVTVLVALPAARVFARYRFRGRSWLRALVLVPFALPTVVIGSSINALIDRFGLRDGSFRLYHTVWAVLLAHVVFNIAVVVRIVGGYWETVDPRLSESARVLGASRTRTLLEVEVPLLRPALVAASAIVFLFCFTSFGVILLVGGPRQATIESEIWRYSVQRTDFHTAAVLSIFQFAAVVAMVVVSSTLERRAQQASAGRRAGAPHRLRGGRERLGAATALAPAALIAAAPLVIMVERSLATAHGHSFENYRQLFSSTSSAATLLVPPIEAVRNSLAIAAVVMVIATVLGACAAIAVGYGKGAASRVFDVGMMLPLGTSAVTLGFGFLIALDEPPLDLRTSWMLVPLAQTLVAVPFVIRIVAPAIRRIDQRWRDAATMLGASPRATWRHIDWPVIARALTAAAAFSFAISLGEFGATSFLARPDTPTIPVAMFRLLSQPGRSLRGMAMALAVILSLLVVVSTLVIERVRPRASVSL